jgi:transcriptional regulator with XRE-family HTH domain
MPGSAPVRRRLLGTALREYRESLGYNLDEAARILDCDRSKISRIETGERGIRAKELRELLTEYGVPASEQEALLAVAHRGRESGWWLDYRDVLSPGAQDYVIMEIAATEILAYEPNQVPDLLQTPRYASAVAEADASCASAEQRAHSVEVKLARQRIALGASATEASVSEARGRQPGAKRLDFVITEGALRQAVGGPGVMRDQLSRLAALADAGAGAGAGASAGASAGVRISVRVLPFAAGAHAAAGRGSMTILRFARTPGIGVIHLAGLTGGVSLEGREEVARYLRTFSRLKTAALTPAESARLLRAMARG